MRVGVVVVVVVGVVVSLGESGRWCSCPHTYARRFSHLVVVVVARRKVGSSSTKEKCKIKASAQATT